MERFVRLLVAGGIVLVTGLWLTAGATVGSTVWLAAVAVAVAGCLALLGGIAVELERPLGLT